MYSSIFFPLQVLGKSAVPAKLGGINYEASIYTRMRPQNSRCKFFVNVTDWIVKAYGLESNERICDWRKRAHFFS
jgi:hypothetical protein